MIVKAINLTGRRPLSSSPSSTSGIPFRLSRSSLFCCGRGFRAWLVSLSFLPACSPQATANPVHSASIPADARVVEECSSLGNLLCGAVSTLSGDGATERRSICTAYVESSGRRVERCGSIPVSQAAGLSHSAQTSQPTKNAPAPKKTVHLSWKDNSHDELGFRIYRITGSRKVKIAELGPNTTTYADKEALPKVCYVVVAFNAAGESPPTAQACIAD